MTEPSETAAFRLAFVPGVTPDKWVRMWSERRPRVPLELVPASTDEAVALIRARAVNAALLRLPIDRSGLHTIPLYAEISVVVVPKQHFVSAAEEVEVADLADEVVLQPRDETLAWPGDRPGRAATYVPDTTAEAIELVAAGVGLLVVPQSLARLHHRRDLVHRPLIDAPQSTVGLAWPDGENSDSMEEFIGIVRGRTVNSSRTPRREGPPGPRSPAPKAAARRGSRRR